MRMVGPLQTPGWAMNLSSLLTNFESLILKIVLHIAIDAQHAARPQLHNIQIQWITVLESRSRKLISTTELNVQKQIGDCYVNPIHGFHISLWLDTDSHSMGVGDSGVEFRFGLRESKLILKFQLLHISMEKLILISGCYENHCENRFSDSHRISSPGIVHCCESLFAFILACHKFVSGEAVNYSTFPIRLIETLYRENWHFRDRDFKRLTQCHTASENFDAELLLNIRVSI